MRSPASKPPCRILSFAGLSGDRRRITGIGGTLACAAACTFDESDCHATRFEASAYTILDRQSGLEPENVDSAFASLSIGPGGAN